MTERLKARALSADAFAPFGEIIEPGASPDKMINDGRCGRLNDLAALDFADGRAGISLFNSELITLPYEFDLLERHPDGSQAFLPTGAARSLVIVASDEGGRPVDICAFLSEPGQGYNLRRGVWHGVLAPLDHGVFFVIDRIGAGDNLELHMLDSPMRVEA